MANVLVAKVTIGLGKNRRIETGKQVAEADVKLLGDDLQRLIEEGHIIEVDVAQFAVAKAAVEQANDGKKDESKKDEGGAA
ncbi:MAG: hypothetical protein ACRDAM_15715 [Casimicrobium sp.]